MRRGYRRVSRGSVFLLAMVALVALLFLGTSLVQVAIHGLSFASNQQKRADALALAESGVEMVLEKLYDGYDAHAPYQSPKQELDETGTYTDDFSLGDGTVNVVVTAPYPGVARSCIIRSTGITRTNRRETIRVIATYQEDVDRVFQGAIFSNYDLPLKGGGTIYPNADGIGASIYAKGLIDFSTQSAFEIDPPTTDPPWPGGTGTIYTAASTVENVPDEVKPENIHTDLSPLPMPAIDVEYYRDQVLNHGQGTYYDRSGKPPQSFTSHTDLAPLGPIIFVEGDVKISGTYSGSACIVATGWIEVQGSGIVATAPGTDSLALISLTSVRMRGGGRVDGLIYAHGVEVQSSASAGGDIEVHGAIVADRVSTNGGITVYYDDVWKGLDIPGRGASQYAQISWEELFE